MRINSINYNNNATSFGNFLYRNNASKQQIIDKVFGSEQRADLFEKLTDEKGIAIMFSNEAIKRTPESKDILSLTAFICDNKPEKGQLKIKTIHDSDPNTVPDSFVQDEFKKTINENPDLEIKGKEFSKILQTKLNKLKQRCFQRRIEDSIIACKAKTRNLFVEASINTEENKNRYGEKLVEEIAGKLSTEYRGHSSADIVGSSTIYNQK